MLIADAPSSAPHAAPAATAAEGSRANNQPATQPTLQPINPLPTLSPEDRSLLALFLRLNEDLNTLAQESGRDLIDLLPWFASAPIQIHLAAYHAALDNRRKQLALNTLESVAKDSKDPIEKRRAAATLLRALNAPIAPRATNPSGRPSTNSSVPSVPLVPFDLSEDPDEDDDDDDDDNKNDDQDQGDTTPPTHVPISSAHRSTPQALVQHVLNTARTMDLQTAAEVFHAAATADATIDGHPIPSDPAAFAAQVHAARTASPTPISTLPSADTPYLNFLGMLGNLEICELRSVVPDPNPHPNPDPAHPAPAPAPTRFIHYATLAAPRGRRHHFALSLLNTHPATAPPRFAISKITFRHYDDI